jgi:Asp-tRNA(Asn)/Glu-tRNA(Gln) amidotransferase A subunit family amidase
VYNDDSFYGKEMKPSIERSAGLPVGIQLTGKSNHDEELLAAMATV